ncbi:MAG: hypothetical protein CMG60_07015 [Candidatus Marinimicrobia bacterium]|nr:hypothetical protein [Candidatus Neomarinimicrobiota bacterium]
MNYIIFEDQKTKLLSPFTDLHATCEMRTGVFTNIQRILFQISDNDTIQLYVRKEIEEILKDKYPNLDINPDLYRPGTYLNGSGIWYSDVMNNLTGENLSYSNQNGLIAFTHNQEISYSELGDFISEKSSICSKIEASSIQYLWDIFEILSDTIIKDSQLLYNYKKGILHPSCVLINADSITINPNAKICAGTILDASGGPIIIDENAVLDIGVLVKGPVYIGKNSIINPGAKIRGPVSIGQSCKVGGEVEDSVIYAFSNKQHDGFLGHSYVGEWVNLGANTNTSDLKNNYSNIRMKLGSDSEIDTGKMFIGSLIGDFSSTAISTRLNSGTYIGLGSNLFSDGFQEKYIHAFTWGKDDKVGLNRFIKKCEISMNRRKKVLSEPLKNRLIHLWKEASDS